MSIRDRLKNALFEEESSDQPAASPAPQAVLHAVPAPTATVVGFPQQPQGVVDPRIKAELEQSIAAANQVSYTEFINFFNAMSGIPDEGTRYRAAIAAAGAKGFNAAEIIRGIDVILQTLATEEREFTSSLPQQLQEKVGSRETEINQLDQTVRDKEAQIRQLQADIQQANTRKGTLAGEIQRERAKIDEVQKRFTATVAAERVRFESEKQRLAAYGGVQ
jgi:chromosome segregation ATPase